MIGNGERIKLKGTDDKIKRTRRVEKKREYRRMPGKRYLAK